MPNAEASIELARFLKVPIGVLLLGQEDGVPSGDQPPIQDLSLLERFPDLEKLSRKEGSRGRHRADRRDDHEPAVRGGQRQARAPERLSLMVNSPFKLDPPVRDGWPRFTKEEKNATFSSV